MPAQLITYNHKVAKPDPQYDVGYYIVNWIYDGKAWDFENDTVEQDIELVAKWEEYHNPTIITINIEDEADLEVKVHYTQSQETISSDKLVQVDWGDGSVWGSAKLQNVELVHSYSEVKDYEIKIYGVSTGYRLGDGGNLNLINPTKLITNVDFAWDFTDTAAQLLLGAENLHEITISPLMTTLRAQMFAGTGLQKITIPSNVVNFETSIFMDCEQLETVNLPDNLTNISSQMFQGCIKLKDIVLPKSLKSIYGSAFRDCDSLEEIIIPENVNDIRSGAFDQCDSLEHVVFLTKHTEYEDAKGTKYPMFEGTTFNLSKKLTTAGPYDPENSGQYSVEFVWDTILPENLFNVAQEGSGLTAVVLPNTLKVIGARCFNECNRLDGINIPNGLEIIGNGAFYHCEGLRQIDVPESLLSLGRQAFALCYGLSDVKLRFASSEFRCEFSEDAWFKSAWTQQAGGNARIHINPDVYKQDKWDEAYGSFWNYGYEDVKYIFDSIEPEGE